VHPAGGDVPENDSSDHTPHPDSVPFRVWPPVALGAPLTGGVALSVVIGEPVRWPDGHEVVALVLALVFAVWNGWSLFLFHRHATGLLPGQPTTELLHRGPFAVSRNPLYLGLLALYLSITFAVPSIWALLLLPVGVLTLLKGAIEPEEAYLRTKFGPAYEEYCRRVRRWL
jgi:protein-S-isoprenylcysteine O-methyltransferase Ste14